ncbi:hypothetical protein ACFLZW_02980 [Chloroflexota bacterium]
MRKFWLYLAVFLLSACTTTQANQPSQIDSAPDGSPTNPFNSILADLDDRGPAPELMNEVWLNSEQPLRLKDLRGKVVLLEMWTFG